MTVQHADCECLICGRMHRYLGRPPSAPSASEIAEIRRAFALVRQADNLQHYRIDQWLDQIEGVARERGRWS